MTNNTATQTRRELRRQNDAVEFANAVAFIVESLADENCESTTELRTLDSESIREFGEIWGFSAGALRKALTRFQQAYLQEEKTMKDL